MTAPGNAWRLLQLHVVRPGRIVTPDLLLTRVSVSGPDGHSAPVAVQRLLTHPAIQLEPGDWAVAPALATVAAMEAYAVPALALLEGGTLAWLFLARQALALADLETPPLLRLDGAPVPGLVPAPPPPPAGAGAVAARIQLGAPAPLGARTACMLSAQGGGLVLADTQVVLERIG